MIQAEKYSCSLGTIFLVILIFIFLAAPLTLCGHYTPERSCIIANKTLEIPKPAEPHCVPHLQYTFLFQQPTIQQTDTMSNSDLYIPLSWYGQYTGCTKLKAYVNLTDLLRLRERELGDHTPTCNGCAHCNHLYARVEHYTHTRQRLINACPCFRAAIQHFLTYAR